MAFTSGESALIGCLRLLTRDRGHHVTHWQDEPKASKLKRAAGSVALFKQPGRSR